MDDDDGYESAYWVVLPDGEAQEILGRSILREGELYDQDAGYIVHQDQVYDGDLEERRDSYHDEEYYAVGR